MVYVSGGTINGTGTEFQGNIKQTQYTNLVSHSCKVDPDPTLSDNIRQCSDPHIHPRRDIEEDTFGCKAPDENGTF